MRKLSAVLAGTVALSLLVFCGGAQASGETATAGLTMTPQSGSLYVQAQKPVFWRVDVEIKAPYPESPEVLPMKRVRTSFPTEMRFNPKKGFPVCPDDKVGPPPVNLSVPPAEVISRCPDAVLGNGSAELYLNRVNRAEGPILKDPVLLVFNGGETSSGLPKIKIYGFSKGTGAGVYMEGTLDHGVLDVAIPVLTYDSAVGRFDLNIPGTGPVVYDKKEVSGSVGLDKSYVTTTCATGSWNGSAQFTLGTRDSAGNPTSPDSLVDSPPYSVDCVGLAGKGKLGGVKVKGPAKVKKRKKGTFKVTVRNNGTATAKGVKVRAKGKGAKGSGKAGNIAPGASKTVKVKVKFTKKGKSKVTFTAKSSNAGSAKGKKTVKVK